MTDLVETTTPFIKEHHNTRNQAGRRGGRPDGGLSSMQQLTRNINTKCFKFQRNLGQTSNKLVSFPSLFAMMQSIFIQANASPQILRLGYCLSLSIIQQNQTIVAVLPTISENFYDNLPFNQFYRS